MSKILKRSDSAKNLYESNNNFLNFENANSNYYVNPQTINNDIFYNTFESLPKNFTNKLNKIDSSNVKKSIKDLENYVSKVDYKKYHANTFITESYKIIAYLQNNFIRTQKIILLNAIKSIFIITYNLGVTLSKYPKTVLVGTGVLVTILYPYHVALTAIVIAATRENQVSNNNNNGNGNNKNSIINDVFGIIRQIPKTFLRRIDTKVIQTAIHEVESGSNTLGYLRKKQYRNLGNNSKNPGLKRHRLFVSQKNAIRTSTAKEPSRPVTRSMTRRN